MPVPSTEQSLHQAVQHHQSNRFSEAESLYREVLSQQPNHAVALYFFARLLGQTGRVSEAVEMLRRCIAINSNVAEPQIALGEFLRIQGKLDESIGLLNRATQIAPANADAFNSLGNSLREAGRAPEAADSFRRAISIQPTYAEAHSNLGNALRALGDFDASITAHSHAVRLKPQSAEIHNNYGIALREKGDVDQSIGAFSRAIELRPDYVEAMNNLGSALVTRGRIDDALAAFQRAAALRPDWPEVQNNLGNVLKEKGRIDDSVAAYERALALRPDFAEAHSNLGINLSAQGRLSEAIESFGRAMQSRPNVPQYFGNLLYTLHFHPDYDADEILRQHIEWAQRYADPLLASASPFSNDRSPDRRVRIGYVSPDFREHPVGRFLLPLLANHDHNQFEVFCYSGVRISDSVTTRSQSYADHWRNLVGVSDEKAAEMVRQDQIDILIDLTLHMTGSRLMMFARKPAPIQVTWLGYIGTTGMKAMDYRISDNYLDPPSTSSGQAPDQPERYTEKTVRLPHCYWCYEPPSSLDVNPLPALTTGNITFGCFNNFMKVTSDALRAWAQTLAAVPRSCLLIHSNPGSHVERVRTVFSEAGVDPARLEFVGMLPTKDYLLQHHRIDIALDPFPYGGGTTTCDALWMGVPVITLSGRTAVGRSGVSILNNVELPQLIAKTQEQYISIAAALADDQASLAELRSSLRRRMQESPLMDARRFAQDMEHVHRGIWREWCKAP